MKICTYEPAIGLCSGCGRTLAEVRSWFDMTDEKRRVIMDELPARLAKAKATS